ncbi:MAG: hypothetical protein U5P41_02595 [Gammaproteobacteria bacterium]|nr:hypothetical protein [Gammaproteobacteria bacterium]
MMYIKASPRLWMFQRITAISLLPPAEQGKIMHSDHTSTTRIAIAVLALCLVPFATAAEEAPAGGHAD